MNTPECSNPTRFSDQDAQDVEQGKMEQVGRRPLLSGTEIQAAYKSKHSRSTRRCLISPPRCRSCLRRVRWLLHYFFLALGIIYFADALGALLSATCPEAYDWVASSLQPPLDQLPSTRSDIFPIACHSHNDYWRPRPLLDAVYYGCTAVEADVWLSESNELLVGHIPSSLSPDRTLSSLYLNPLLEILNQANHKDPGPYMLPDAFSDGALNGVFATAPSQSLILLIDFKSDALQVWSELQSALSPLRQQDYLSYSSDGHFYTGPLTIIVSGNAPFDEVLKLQHRDIFFDAPLDRLAANFTSTEGSSLSEFPTSPNYDDTNSFYASVSFIHSIGYPTHSTLTRSQLTLLRSQIREAHARGLKVRYWDIPAWPVGVRNYLWRVMVREGVDYLSVDDVRAVAKDNWGPRKGGWGKKWWF